MKSSARRGGLMAAAVAMMLVHSPLVQAETGFKAVTIAGTFSVPRRFVPISLWETMRIPTAHSNYFVFRLPAAYVAERVPSFISTESGITQDVVVAVQVLDALSRHALSPGKTCWRGTHDGISTSQPYQRCLYVHVSEGHWAVKYGLNGQNAARDVAIAPLIDELLSVWRSASPTNPTSG